MIDRSGHNPNVHQLTNDKWRWYTHTGADQTIKRNDVRKDALIVLQSRRLSRHHDDWATELNWTAKSWLIWKDPDWERMKAGGEGDCRGWDGWMVSPTQCRWVWVDFRSWWWTGRSGMLWSMGSPRVGHDWMTKLNWIDSNRICWLAIFFFCCC